MSANNKDLLDGIASGVSLKSAPEATSYVSSETQMKQALKGFDKNALKKVETQEKNPLPTKADIDAEKTSSM